MRVYSWEVKLYAIKAKLRQIMAFLCFLKNPIKKCFSAVLDFDKQIVHYDFNSVSFFNHPLINQNFNLNLFSSYLPH